MIANEIEEVNKEIAALYEKVKNQESMIEGRMHQMFGSETEGVSLFNTYSQIKRVLIVWMVLRIAV